MMIINFSKQPDDGRNSFMQSLTNFGRRMTGSGYMEVNPPSSREGGEGEGWYGIVEFNVPLDTV